MLTSGFQWPHFQTLWHELAGQDWLMWPRKALATLAIMSAALGALVVGVLASDDGSDAMQLQTQRQALQTQVQAQQARLHQWNIEPRALRHEAMSLEQAAWPTAAQSQSVVMALYAQAQRHGLQVDSFKPEEPQPRNGLKSRSLSLRLHGQFAQILSWSDALFHQAALWVPEKWILTASPSGEVSLEAWLHLPLRSEVATWVSPAGIDSRYLFNPKAKESLTKGLTKNLTKGDPFIKPLAAIPQSSHESDLGMGVHPLRRWPLHEMEMVGIFDHAGARHALILTPAGLFRLAWGEVIGLEGGRVIALDELELQVGTPFKQADGRWVQRVDVLPIRHANVTTKEKRP